MNFITLLNYFFLKHRNPNSSGKYFNATLNVALLLLINFFTILKMSEHFFSSTCNIFNRYGSILTIIVFIAAIFINITFRDKNLLNNYQNIIIDKNKTQLIYGYIIATILLFLILVLI